MHIGMVLDKDKGQYSVQKVSSPIGDKKSQNPVIDCGFGSRGVAFPLIPDDTAHGIGSNGAEHGMKTVYQLVFSVLIK